MANGSRSIFFSRMGARQTKQHLAVGDKSVWRNDYKFCYGIGRVFLDDGIYWVSYNLRQ